MNNKMSNKMNSKMNNNKNVQIRNKRGDLNNGNK